MIIRMFIFLFSLSAVVGCAPSLEREISSECGGRARLVWCQDAGDGADVGAQGTNLYLMGFDTDDGRGARSILAERANYAKPMFAPDGERVVFSRWQEQKIYTVNFDGSGLKPLADGFAMAVWRNARSKTDWVYAGTVIDVDNSLVNNIRRFRLDKPEVSESVWTKTPHNIDNFQLSADGGFASGLFPWPSCGLAELPDREWTKYAEGCWPSLSPDNERLLWVFDGAHRNLCFFRTKTGARWAVNISHAPGIGGFEVYHPRWSNSPRFFTMTGPYKMGGGDNRIRAGGKGIEIYLGKFAPDFRKIERWIRVTHNEYGDFFPDLWVSSRGKTAAAEASAAPEADGLKKTQKAPAGAAWPGSLEELVFLWQNRSKANAFTEPISQTSRVCRVEAKGRARYGRHFEMAPSGGAFIADENTDELKKRVMERQQLAVEIMLTPGGNEGKELLPIVGHAARSGGWNFLIAQKGRRLVFQIRAGRDQPPNVVSLGAPAGDGPCHVVVSCLASNVTCYLNGEQAGYHEPVWAGPWEDGEIVFGNELRAEYPVNGGEAEKGWRGLIENVALYARWIGLEEVREKYKTITAASGARGQIPFLSVKAELISAPVVPAPASIAPYRRALLIGHYRIREIMEGNCPEREIMAATWSILDGQTLSGAGRSSPGRIFRMSLEPFSDHPELEGERQIMDGDRFDLPLYYEIEGR
ncbi:MAG: hypothetical protein PHP98_00540 [Kiritimatiellae bacterium]|nr:hypothetical protein [Kiritimatiellia bacterium]